MSSISTKCPSAFALFLTLLIAGLPAIKANETSTTRTDFARELLSISRRGLSHAYSLRTAAFGLVADKRGGVEAWKPLLVTHAISLFAHDASLPKRSTSGARQEQGSLVGAQPGRYL